MAKVGIVIPARNEEETLIATLKMLNAQRLRPRVIMVVDDGSTDKTAEIARKMNCMFLNYSSLSSNEG